jgi:hypothetical protein
MVRRSAPDKRPYRIEGRISTQRTFIPGADAHRRRET